MSTMFNLTDGGSQQRYGTGMWPFYYPRPWNMHPPHGIGAIVDPVAIAAELAKELRKTGWPGISLMGEDFQLELLETAPDDLAQLVQKWFADNLGGVADLMQSRLGGYVGLYAFKTAKEAMTEAISAYRDQKFLVVTRLLMPEFESVGRSVLDIRDKTTTGMSQNSIIREFIQVLGSTPVIKQDPLESMSLFYFVSDRLFASCYTEADAAAFGSVPNRHAELHGLGSYGNLQGASVILCAFDLILKLLQTRIELAISSLSK